MESEYTIQPEAGTETPEIRILNSSSVPPNDHHRLGYTNVQFANNYIYLKRTGDNANDWITFGIYAICHVNGHPHRYVTQVCIQEEKLGYRAEITQLELMDSN